MGSVLDKAKLSLNGGLYKEAIQYYENAYEQGYDYPIKNLIDAYEGAAKLGDSDALFKLGELYENGKRIYRNMNKAVYYYELAEELDNPDAIYRIAQMYDFGDHKKSNSEKANILYEKAARLGSRFAMYAIGNKSLNGLGMKKDIDKAIDYLEKAAALDVPFAMYDLGVVYQFGEFGYQNLDKAIYYYKQIADFPYFVDAAINLAVVYSDIDEINNALTYIDKAIRYLENDPMQNSNRLGKIKEFKSQLKRRL